MDSIANEVNHNYLYIFKVYRDEGFLSGMRMCAKNTHMDSLLTVWMARLSRALLLFGEFILLFGKFILLFGEFRWAIPESWTIQSGLRGNGHNLTFLFPSLKKLFH